MKKLLLLLIIGWLLATSVWAQSTQTIQYEASDTNFANPERGWQKTFNPTFATNEQYPVYTTDELKALREDEKITLVDKYYVLIDYRNTAIPQSYLDDFQADMDAIREVGLKAAVRFAYNFNGNDLADTDITRVLQHIAQLKPYLQKNADVIAFMEAGFAGKWGEWHGSTDDLLGGPYLVDVNANTRKLYDALFDALPAKRMVTIRYVYQMQQLLNQKDCQVDGDFTYDFPEAIAFSGSPQARTGRHDDWFMGDAADNSGTWSYDEADRNCQKRYLEEQSKYVPITTGETQVLTDFTKNTSPIPTLERFHFASLSINPGYDPEAPIRLWRENGVFDEMSKRFGYRFVLKSATVPTSVAAGDTLTLSFAIQNVGFASPYNPRSLEVVLRNQATGQIEKYDVTNANGNELDPRFWFRENETMNKKVSVALDDIAPGEYDVLLHLPDPEPTLYGRPEFSIRLANKDIWEDATGYNDLNATVTVESSPQTTDVLNGVYELHPASAPNHSVTVVSQGNGANVERATDRDLASQRWQLTRQANGYYRASPTSSERQCLDVRKRSVAEGANVQTWQCNRQGQSNQEWKITIEDAAKGYYSFSPRHADEQGMSRRLAVSGEGSSTGTNLELAVSDRTKTQHFVLERVIENSARTLAPAERELPSSIAGTKRVVVYPNPSNGNITLEGITDDSILRLYDTQGRPVQIVTERQDERRRQVRLLKTLPGGLYLLKVQHPDGTQIERKLMIE